MAACLQGHVVSSVPQVETYKLVCWRSGSIVAFDQRVAQLRGSTLAFYDGWHRSDRYSEQDREVIDKQLQDILSADLESSRSWLRKRAAYPHSGSYVHGNMNIQRKPPDTFGTTGSAAIT